MRFDKLPLSLVVSTEHSGIDRYSQELAKRLPVSPIHTTRYGAMRQHLRLGWDLMRARQAVHFSNHHLGRWICWLTQPCIVTVHDLVRLAFPHAPEDRMVAIGLALDRRGIRNATHVICVSEATKKDLMQHLAVEEEKITVIHNGIDHSVFKPSAVNDGRFSAPYVLYVGSERPRKNLACLLRAFAPLKDRGPRFASLRLLKVGSPRTLGWVPHGHARRSTAARGRPRHRLRRPRVGSGPRRRLFERSRARLPFAVRGIWLPRRRSHGLWLPRCHHQCFVLARSGWVRGIAGRSQRSCWVR